VEAVAAVCGPGSYAGIRAGLATAEGFAMARGLPAVGISTMEAVAAAAGRDHGLLIHPVGRGTFATLRLEHGLATAPLVSARAEDLAEEPLLAGEGAGELGGIEVSPLQRCVAALSLARERLASGSYAPPVAIYLREPAITRPRQPL
jgi:hypothetical protein